MDLKFLIEKIVTQGPESLTQEEKETLKSMGNQNGIKGFLSRITIENIVRKSEAFHALNIKKLTDEELFNALMDAISFDVDGSKRSFIMHRGVSYPEGTRFYRIRKFIDGDGYLPLKTMSIEQDAWNAPEKNCNIGRLNKDGESLLYTSHSPNICVEETDIKDNERFCLIVYEAKKEIKSTLIDRWQDQHELSKEDNQKMRMINNILIDSFSSVVDKGAEFLYRLSERIAKDYYDLPRDCQDAWCYPSVAAKQGYNCCFRPDVAKEVLNLIGVQVCSVNRMDENYCYKCDCILVWNKDKEGFDYYRVDSPECRHLFPEIVINKA
jgi:hypothetical protein